MLRDILGEHLLRREVCKVVCSCSADIVDLIPQSHTSLLFYYPPVVSLSESGFDLSDL